MHRDLALPERPEPGGISYSFGVFTADSAIKRVTGQEAKRGRQSLFVFKAEVMAYLRPCRPSQKLRRIIVRAGLNAKNRTSKNVTP